MKVSEQIFESIQVDENYMRAEDFIAVAKMLGVEDRAEDVLNVSVERAIHPATAILWLLAVVIEEKDCCGEI